ncbi:phosphoenolpyruvate--protein phosphotransferase [Pseudomonas sp. RIT-PI-S]|uniref:phosphoenolpyruvate--protein phosphotransferase n=1 Tax=Pseudomonas sp. RIT-PI-S TaxID=3035295 RepID=UPI0021D98BB2|nr:phosphoenolpyruvate--protein phosphotransferase [Pseudomonas sp. RIT-PI-S]
MPNNNYMTLNAPFSGPVITLNNIPDPVFASGALGDGMAIDPLGDVLHAPFSGQVINVARTRHAINLRAHNGSEWLLHVGIDTVELNGEGFHALVTEGQRVSQGEPLLRMDLDQVARHSRSLVSAFILLNGDQFKLTPIAGPRSVNVGDALLEVIPLSAAAGAPSTLNAGPAGEARGRARIAHGGGLHARPAALVREAARQFESRVHVHFAGASASADSVTALMALGTREQDEVEVRCEGPDCDRALEAVLAALATPTVHEAAGMAVSTPAPHRAGDRENGMFNGVPASPGLVSGPLVRLDALELPKDPGGHCANQQRHQLTQALAQVRADINASLDSHPGEHNAIFATHMAMLEDPALLSAAYAHIEQGHGAAHAWSHSVLAQCEVLETLGNPLLGERAGDLRDLRQRVLLNLLGDARAPEIPPGAIVLAQELTPSDLVMLSSRGVGGICMALGGPTSHVAILARGAGIPCVVALGAAVLEPLAAATHPEVVLDADAGRLELKPGAERLALVRAQMQERAHIRQREQQHAHSPAATCDGVRIEVAANVASAEDAQRARGNGADSVGLLRSEFLFVDRATAPTQAEQTLAYQAVLDAMVDQPVIIRTIDIGGDKQLDYLPLPAEANPVLGLRGIRLGQARPELLDEQLRALLQVKPLARCRILLPMISEIDELLAVRARIDHLASELGLQERPELGVMIEVPSAALMAEQLAEHADFLSIGTNDLTQYTLAMDRDHTGLAERVDALHPAVLRLIGMTCRAAEAHGCWVGVCGALASDPLATAALIGLGVRELSVSPPQIGQIKARVRELDSARCQALASQLQALGSAAQARVACAAFERRP